MIRFVCGLMLLCALESESLLNNIWETQSKVRSEEYQRKVSEIIRKGGTTHSGKERVPLFRNGPLQFLKDFQVDNDSDWQYAADCGNYTKKIKLKWKPKVIDPDGTLTVAIDMVAPVSLMNGTARIDVYVVREEDPIFTIEQDFTCEDIRKLAHFINCPIQKGFPLKREYTNTELTRLPVGDYRLVVKVKNEKGEEFGCVNGTVNLQPNLDM